MEKDKGFSILHPTASDDMKSFLRLMASFPDYPELIPEFGGVDSLSSHKCLFNKLEF